MMGHCVIRDKASCQIIAKVPMANNKMLPQKVSMVERCALMTSAESNNETRLWHLHYGHLNINGLKLLNRKEIVFGLPKLDNFGFCENCVCGTKVKNLFL